ncbi:MAG TPA: WD40 repeat domain-containing protein [Chloroflexia bacterium]|jgi:WD40 repeat protein
MKDDRLVLGPLTPQEKQEFDQRVEEAKRNLRAWVPGPAESPVAPSRHLMAALADSERFTKYTCLAVHPGGNIVAASGYDGAVRIWTLDDRLGGGPEPVQPSRRLEGCTGRTTGLSFTPDGTELVAGSAGWIGYSPIFRWNVSDWRPINTPEIKLGHSVLGLSVRPSSTDKSGVQLVTVSGDWGGMGNMAQVWDLKTGSRGKLLKRHSSHFASVAIRADGRVAALGSGGWGSDYAVRLWDPNSGKVLHELPTNADPNEMHTATVSALAFSPTHQSSGEVQGGRRLASASYDGTIRIWQVSDGKQLGLLRGHGWLSSVDWNAKGDMLAAGSYDRTVQVWKIGTPRPILVLQGHTERVTAVVWCPPPRQNWLMSAGWDGKVHVWSIITR